MQGLESITILSDENLDKESQGVFTLNEEFSGSAMRDTLRYLNLFDSTVQNRAHEKNKFPDEKIGLKIKFGGGEMNLSVPMGVGAFSKNLSHLINLSSQDLDRPSVDKTSDNEFEKIVERNEDFQITKEELNEAKKDKGNLIERFGNPGIFKHEINPGDFYASAVENIGRVSFNQPELDAMAEIATAFLELFVVKKERRYHKREKNTRGNENQRDNEKNHDHNDGKAEKKRSEEIQKSAPLENSEEAEQSKKQDEKKAEQSKKEDQEKTQADKNHEKNPSVTQDIFGSGSKTERMQKRFEYVTEFEQKSLEKFAEKQREILQNKLTFKGKERDPEFSKPIHR